MSGEAREGETRGETLQEQERVNREWGKQMRENKRMEDGRTDGRAERRGRETTSGEGGWAKRRGKRDGEDVG